VTAAEVEQIRSSVLRGVRRAPIVGGFIAGVLDVFVFSSMRAWAHLGFLRTRTVRRPAMRRRRDGGDGFGTAGVGARLPVIPPSMSGAAALSIPIHPTTDDPG
jgi:hypothetical protein